MYYLLILSIFLLGILGILSGDGKPFSHFENAVIFSSGLLIWTGIFLLNEPWNYILFHLTCLYYGFPFFVLIFMFEFVHIGLKRCFQIIAESFYKLSYPIRQPEKTLEYIEKQATKLSHLEQKYYTNKQEEKELGGQLSFPETDGTLSLPPLRYEFNQFCKQYLIEIKSANEIKVNEIYGKDCTGIVFLQKNVFEGNYNIRTNFYIKESTENILLNGQRIDVVTKLKQNDLIQINNVVLRFNESSKWPCWDYIEILSGKLRLNDDH